MTWGRWARLLAYTTAFGFLAWYGAWAMFAGLWMFAAMLYLLALALALLGFGEWQTAADYADAVDARQPTAPTSRAHARRLAHRVLAHECLCDRWWTSFGTDHDPWCPIQLGAPPHACRPHPRRRAVPRRRAAAAARRHRRHRPR
ncbi:hypothetical protein ABZ379_48875 [Streptomyces canus]|uniref:hypothetical protein n=1 Tax=Streptomyces canus TaxID=58343 RepID=UPI0033EFB4FF